MKIFFSSIIILLINASLFGQNFNDLIITKNLDSIRCKITMVNDLNIFYQYKKKKNIKTDYISRELVLDFQGENIESITVSKKDVKRHNKCDTCTNWIVDQDNDTIYHNLIVKSDKAEIKVYPLEKVAKKSKLKNRGKAIIYGNFVRRIIKYGAGYSQTVVIYNKTTKKFHRMFVLPDAKLKNMYAFYIDPGEYEIVAIDYGFNKTFIHGNVYYRTNEAVYNKNLKVEEPKSIEELIRYSFTIEDKSIYYVGNWDFSTEDVKFTSDKKNFDSKFMLKYGSLRREETKTVIPK